MWQARNTSSFHLDLLGEGVSRGDTTEDLVVGASTAVGVQELHETWRPM
jgi:hypothetical protein